MAYSVASVFSKKDNRIRSYDAKTDILNSSFRLVADFYVSPDGVDDFTDPTQGRTPEKAYKNIDSCFSSPFLRKIKTLANINIHVKSGKYTPTVEYPSTLPPDSSTVVTVTNVDDTGSVEINPWVYNGNIEFINCTFNGGDKPAFTTRNVSGAPHLVRFKNCTFIDTPTAIESKGTTIFVEGNSTLSITKKIKGSSIFSIGSLINPVYNKIVFTGSLVCNGLDNIDTNTDNGFFLSDGAMIDIANLDIKSNSDYSGRKYITSNNGFVFSLGRGDSFIPGKDATSTDSLF